ncbi:MBL fold metallo-hydrolase [bacterium]|nr:MBL fold metallo-hydrolase [bacterium]
MKIRKIGWTSFTIEADNITIVTDPLVLKESGFNVPKTQADVALFTDYKEEIDKTIIEDSGIDSKIVPNKRETIFEIYTPGEYEIGGVMIRRNQTSNYYIIDEGPYRVVYMGGIGKEIDVDSLKKLADVDVLILPVGEGEKFADYDTLEKISSNLDPAIIIPCAYSEDGGNISNVKSKDDFLKHFGYTNVVEANYLAVTKKKVEEEQQSSVKIVVLK